MKSQIVAFLLVPLFMPLGLLDSVAPEPQREPVAWQRQVDWKPKAQVKDDETVFSAFASGVRVGATRVKLELNTSKFAVGMSLSL